MLSVRRPTLNTVLYTVSSRSPSTTVASRASKAGLFLARVSVTGLILIVLLHEYCLAWPVTSVGSAALRDFILKSPLGESLDIVNSHSTRIWRLIISTGLIWLISRKSCIEESLLVIRGLGVQVSTSSSSYLWTSSTRFIPTRSIQDIFIHEAFKGFEVKFYLAIVVEGEADVVVVFPVSHLILVKLSFKCGRLLIVRSRFRLAERSWNQFGAGAERVCMN